MGSDNQALLYEKPANKMDGDSSSRGRLQAGASSAATRTRASSSMAVPISTSSEGFPARPQSACSMRPPTPQGLAMIKTTEKTPPPTNMTFEEALATLHQLEKQLTIEVQKDIQKLRAKMTAAKIELVARKSKRLYDMRVLLNTTRRLCREEADIMDDFGGVKSVIDSEPKHPKGIDDDDYMVTKSKLLVLGGKLTDIRRKQQKLAGQVEELQGAMNELVDMSQIEHIEGYEFNMESFKRESSALPEMPKIAASLPSYSLFNSAPYSPSPSRPESAMSDMSLPPMTCLSPTPGGGGGTHRTIKISVAGESTDDEDLPSDAYLPQRSGFLKKKDRKRYDSETESEDGAPVYDNRMTPQEAKQRAEGERTKAVEEEARIQRAGEEQKRREKEEEEKKQEDAARLQKAVEENLRKEEEAEKRRQEELEIKKKEDDLKKKAVMEAKQKAAAERAAELEAKRKADEDKKKAEMDAKRKQEQEKKKAETDAKKKKEEEAKKKKEEIAAKKKAEADEKKRAMEEAKKKAEKEEAALKKAEEEEKVKKAEELKKKEARWKQKEEEAAAKLKAEKEELEMAEERRKAENEEFNRKD